MIAFLCALCQTLARLLFVIAIIHITIVNFLGRATLTTSYWIPLPLLLAWLPFAVGFLVVVWFFKCDECSRFAFVVTSYSEQKEYKRIRKTKKWEDLLNWRELRHGEFMCVHCHTAYTIR